VARDGAHTHRLAHLRPTHRLHACLAFIEAFAFSRVRQIEKVQQARERPAKIVDPVNQPYWEQRVRQLLAPMRHQPIVLRYIPAEVGQIMSIGVLAVKNGT
jgi:hypothetical protein